MEDLTKQQIVLVTLLVSFVTSIATGIVTVSLMDQAPKAVTQTINQVVEHTIEKVVPTQNEAAAIVTKETVVINPEDQITSAIDQNTKKVVKIGVFKNGSEHSVFLAEGLIISKDGYVISDSSIADPNAKYEAVFSDNIHMPIQFKKTYDSTGLSLFLLTSTSSSTTKMSFSPVTFADSSNIKLGQNVLTLGGKESTTVSTGIVTAKIGTSTDRIATSLEPNKTFLGSPLINLNGEVVGIKTDKLTSSEDNLFLASNAFRNIFKDDLAGISLKDAGTAAQK